MKKHLKLITLAVCFVCALVTFVSVLPSRVPAQQNLPVAPQNTATGDFGTFIASFNGAAQTNTSYRGALITVALGTVSGTTPTLAAQLQWSPDGGTTWLNYGAVLPNLTASSQTGTIIVYPANTSTAGATPAAFTLGATVNVQSNAPLPRTWRLAYTIGGTTPSFAISSVQVNYLN